jgi:hypothetical protein
MNTHESMKLKSSPPSSGTEDSPATVLEAEALEEANTSARFLFLSMTRSSDSAGGGHAFELVLSSESLLSSPSWLSSVSGALEATETGTCLHLGCHLHLGWPLPLGEEGEKQGVGDPGKRNNPKITT